jgi:PAS domain S-box-containing protein
MKDEIRTKSELIRELKSLRRRNKRLEVAESRRRKVEKLLRESEATYRSIFENSLDAILLTAPDGRIFSANPAACQMYGRTEEEICKVGRESLVDLQDPHLAELLKRRALTGKASGEFYQYRKDGTRFPTEVSSAVFEIGEGKRTSMIIRDITMRKRIEEELSAVTLRQRAILAADPDIIMEVDNNKIYTWTNQAGREFFGDDVIGKEANFYFEGNQDTYNVVKPLFKGAEDVIYIESWQHRKDGEKRLLAWWCRMLKDPTGKISGALSSARDITERKQAEEEIRKSHKELRMLANHLQNIREEERNHLAREFHDQIGQSMTALKMDLSLLLRTISDEKQDVPRKLVAEELQSMQKLVDETSQLLWAIVTELRPQMLDDLGLVTTFEWEAKRFESRTGISCEFKSSEKEILLDPKKSIALFRIYQEALTNITRHAKATVVRSVLRRENEMLVLEIKDNGCGISIDKKSEPESFGLIGMRERTLALGGLLEIIGIAGEGTTIIVRLPLEQVATQESTSK